MIDYHQPQEPGMNRWIALLALASVACTTKENPPAADSVTSTAATAAESDPDKNVGGGALPAGYTARTDKADAKISDAKYVADGNSWEVTTGPAHIVYAAKDVANGAYTVSTTIEQLEAPAHPEAYGVFIGGHDLDNDNQTYTYFLVRGTGELAVKVREGGKARDVLKWTASPDVPKADGSGKARYDLAVQVANDAVKFMVNGKQAASVSKAGLPTDGIAGLRINHNLHLKANPVSIKTP
jgi:hypothetical protein